MKGVFFRADEADHLAWRERALREGMPFGRWVTKHLNDVIGVTLQEKPKPVAAIVQKTVGVCLSRVEKGAWCKKCGKTH